MGEFLVSKREKMVEQKKGVQVKTSFGFVVARPEDVEKIKAENSKFLAKKVVPMPHQEPRLGQPGYRIGGAVFR